MKLYPLTNPQLSVRYMERFFGGSIANITCSAIFKEHIGVEKLKNAVLKTIMICDSLRIRIVEKDGGELQYIHDGENHDIDVVCFDKNEEFLKWVDRLAKKPFDVYGCLFKFYIIKICGKTGLTASLHHLTADAWTMNFLFNTVMKILNENNGNGSEDGEKAASYSYTDFVEREKIYENSAVKNGDREYFLSCFKKCPEPVYLSEKQTQGIKSERLSLVVSNNYAKKISNFCGSKNISVYSLFMNALGIYFYRLKDADALYIGTTVLNRRGKRERETAGNFINTVPVLLQIDGAVSAFENIQRNNKTLSRVLRRQKYHYSEFLKDIRKEYGFDGKLFDIVLNYQNASLIKTDADIKWHFCGCQSENMVIHINDRKNEGAFYFDYDYRSELFSADDIRFFHEHILNIVLSIVKEPEKKPSGLKLLSDDEYKKIVYDFNNTEIFFQTEKCVHQIFEEQTVNYPKKNAVITSDKSLTYKELNEQANVIAHNLIKSKIGVNDIVAVKFSRNIKLIPLLMGILKSGAAYLPIDPVYPTDRINYILKDSHTSFVVTEDNIGSLLISDFDNKNDIENPNVFVNSENLCYIIYTSGSTGMPKGTLITHKNAVNFCINSNKNVFGGIIKDNMNIIASITTISFDIFVTESLLPLLNGITVVLANENQCITQSLLSELIINHNAYVLQTTPTKMKMLISDNRYTDYLKCLKVIILGGEPLDASLVTYLKSLTEAAVYNIYGPTETTVWCMFSLVSDNADNNDITVGKPAANTQVYILDKELNPLPIGAAGEIYIAGKCVGNGYINNPELTAEKFIDNKFGNGKMYRTGDFGKWCKDGNVKFIGRVDNQIKFRGMRIELGEIENQLERFENIEQAVTAVKTDDKGRQCICAYYTGENIRIEDVKSELSKKLPQYMLPGFYKKIDIFPVTPSGKIDFKSLPEPNFLSIDKKSESEYIKPVTEKEVKLINVMQSTLGISSVGMNDDFFSLGGDSLKVIEFITAARDRGFDFSPQNVYDHKTPALLLKSTNNENKDLSEYPLPRSEILFKIFLLISGFLWRFEVKGINNIPAQSNFILCPNHQSDLDSFWVFSALYKKIPNMAKICTLIAKEHLNGGFSKIMFKLLGGIPVERTGNNVSAVLAYERCIECIKSGYSALIHPEGTRTRDGKIKSFKNGAAKIAINSEAVVVPVFIEGAFDVFMWKKKIPKFFRIGKRYKIKISFGKPLSALGKNADELTAELREAVLNLKDKKQRISRKLY